MTEKIKIISVKKTDEFKRQELYILKGIKADLLKNSDWTQTLDAPISYSCLISWQFWRHKVRSVDLSTYFDIEKSKSLLEYLENNKPKIEKINKFDDKLELVFYKKLNFFDKDVLSVQTLQILKKLKIETKKYEQRIKNCDSIEDLVSCFIEVLKNYGY